MERMIEHICEENDNTVKIYLDEDTGELDEISIGCEYAPKDGYIVVGGADLSNALDKTGYKIIKG